MATTPPVDATTPLLRDSPPTTDTERNPIERKTVSTLEAFGIVISIVIGSGIFTSPGSIDANVPTPFVSLAVWFVGGLLAWSGAATLAELSAAIPGEGGIQPYLSLIYGDSHGFLAAWTWVFAIMPATVAILSIVFVDTILTALSLDPSWFIRKLLAVFILLLASLANCISTETTTKLNNFFVTTKFFTIAFIVLASFSVVVIQLLNDGEPIDAGGKDWYRKSWFEPRVSLNPDGTETHWEEISTWETLGHISTALYGALWAYSGWDKALYVSAEMKEPARQLPLAINAALPTIIGCFLAANSGYYILLPWNEISVTDGVAVTAISRLLGPSIGLATSLLITLVVTGSLLGNSFVAGRMAAAAANRSWLPAPLGQLSRLNTRRLMSPIRRFPITSALGVRRDTTEEDTRGDCPVNAIGLVALLGSVYIFFGDFRALVTFNGIAEYTFFFLAVFGALILRVKAPTMRRPYKPYILMPVVFALVAGFVVIRGALFAPAQARVLGWVWAVGIAYYYYRQWEMGAFSDLPPRLD